MEWADRIRTQAMATLLRTFADTAMYDERGGTVQITPQEIEIEQTVCVADEGVMEEWIYTTRIGLQVTRRRAHR